MHNNEGDFDRVVCAEIPDPETQPELHQLVMKHMIHTPCDGTHPESQPCIKNGCCSRGYPQEFQNYTRSNEHGYPLYRRRSPEKGGFTGIKKIKYFGKEVGRIEIDNSWVVSYNKYLLWKYKAHINVEICCSILAVKYLYKYLYKGPDRATVEIRMHKYNEVKRYIDSLYISPEEAVWKILAFPMHDRTPTVQILEVHLPTEQYVYWKTQASIKHTNYRKPERKTKKLN